MAAASRKHYIEGPYFSKFGKYTPWLIAKTCGLAHLGQCFP